jgi:hypothetical protein
LEASRATRRSWEPVMTERGAKNPRRALCLLLCQRFLAINRMGSAHAAHDGSDSARKTGRPLTAVGLATLTVATNVGRSIV